MALSKIDAANFLDGTLPDTNINNASLDNVTGLPAGVGGKVLQVVLDNTTGSISTSSQTFVTTSQSLSITPSSASNKILVLFDCIVATLAANTGIEIEIRRASSSIATTSMYTATVSGNLSTMGGTSILDSPNTTSATTYEVFFRETALAGTVNLSQRRLHLMEIAG